MKKKISLILMAVLTLSFVSIRAAQYEMPDNPRAVPESVYQVPFMPDRFTTQYAPWLKNFNLMSAEENEKGIYGGEACQQLEVFDISPVDPDIMYFITDTTGVYKTHDGGEHWYSAQGNIGGYFGHGLVCDRFDKEIVYASLGREGVWRTRNGGKMWELILRDNCNNTQGHYYAEKLEQDALGNTYIGASTGIYRLDRETDELVNLTPQFANHKSSQEIKVYDIWASDEGQHIYASVMNSADVPGGIYISHDYGKTWEIVDLFPDAETGTSATSVTAHPEDPNHIFATAGPYNIASPKFSVTLDKPRPDTPTTLWESRDGGKTWEEVYALYYSNAEEKVPSTQKNMYRLKFGPMKDGIYPLYMTGTEITFWLRVSYDYGRTFTPMFGRVHAGTIREDVNGVGETGWFSQGYDPVMDNPDVVWFCQGGPCRWENSEIVRKSSGFSGLSVTHMEMSKEGKMMLTATDVGTVPGEGLYTANSYPTFHEGAGGVKTKFLIDPRDSEHIIAFVGSSNDTNKNLGAVESFDGGKTYTKIKEDSKTDVNTSVFEYDSKNPDIIYSSDYTSYDNGKTWKPNSKRLIDVDDNNPDRMLASVPEGDTRQLWLSEDHGETWRYVATPNKNYEGFRFDLGSEDYIWYTGLQAFGKIQISTGAYIDLGVKIAKKFGYGFFRGFSQNPKDPNHIMVPMRAWAKSDVDHKNPGVVESRDGGENWHVIPGFWPAFMQGIYYSTTTDDIFFTGHAGTFIYDYKKHWEFLDSKISVFLNGKEVSFSVMPEITQGRTMVPMRELFEMLGATVEWDAETQSVKGKRGGDSVTLRIGSDSATVRGKQVTIDAAPYIKNGRTMIPLRLVSEALGLNVGWSGADRRIVIK